MAHLEFHQDQAGRRSDKGGTGRSNSQVSAQMQELLRRRKVMIEVRHLAKVQQWSPLLFTLRLGLVSLQMLRDTSGQTPLERT